MSGTLQASVVKDSASATNNLALDASGNVTVGNNLTVTGATTFTGGFSGALTAPAFIPSGSTVPANGMYLSAANTLNLSTNTTNQVQISSAGIVTGTAGNLMLVQGTSQATTSGTSITFTGIPSWAKRITMSLNGVSTSGTSAVQVQLGSGSATTSGYAGLYTALGGPSVFSANVTSGLVLNTATGDTASALRNGIITFTNLTGNSWVGTGTIGVTNATYGCVASTAITLSGILDRIILTTVNGTDTFDAGSVNIQYE